jgi:hypothetical protein
MAMVRPAPKPLLRSTEPAVRSARAPRLTNVGAIDERKPDHLKDTESISCCPFTPTSTNRDTRRRGVEYCQIGGTPFEVTARNLV